MACSRAIDFCISQYGNHDEEVILSGLSCVREQIQKGLKYYSYDSPGNTELEYKENVLRFVKRISCFLELSESRSYELLVHYLATQDSFDESQISAIISSGSMSQLLENVRRYYWQDRLSLLRLLKLSFCNWHDNWSSVSDVLFVMTSHACRADLLFEILSDYLEAYQNTCSFIENWSFNSSNLCTSLGIGEYDECDQFDAIITQRLQEMLELVELILLGVFHVVDNSSGSLAVHFTKILEAFWSISFGMSLKRLIGSHQQLIEQICFIQALILIRAAHLDIPSLFPLKVLDKKKESIEHLEDRKNASKGKSLSSGSSRSDSIKNTKQFEKAVEHDQNHFLNDHRLLNRLLASLSDLGDSPVHGPLLLFGAVCATAFGGSLQSDGTISSSELKGQNVKAIPEHNGNVGFSETSHLVAGQYAQVAIEKLRVFPFLISKLNQNDFETSKAELKLGLNSFRKYNDIANELSLSQTNENNMSLVNLCAYSAIFDLLTLLARDIVLWSLDSSHSYNSHVYGTFDCPNRDAFLSLFSRTLRVVVLNAHLVIRYVSCKTESDSNVSGDTSTTNRDSGSGVGYRIFGLIESLMESFPYDLSVLRIYTSLLVPVSDKNEVPNSVNLSKVVSELIDHVPYVAQPLNETVYQNLSTCAVSWSPQLTEGGDAEANNHIILTKPQNIFSVDSNLTHWFEFSRDFNLHDSSNSIFSGVSLPNGVYGVIKPDLNLIVWRIEYSLWCVLGNEIYLADLALKELHKMLTSDTKVERNSSQTFTSTSHFVHIPGGHSPSSPSVTDIQINCYIQFYVKLLRLWELLRFITACIKSNIHNASCVILLEHIWTLITRYLSLIPTNRLNNIIQNVNKTDSYHKMFSHLNCELYNSDEKCSDSSFNPITNLVSNNLFPGILHLVGTILINISTTNLNQTTVMKNVDLIINFLSKGGSKLLPHLIIKHNSKGSEFVNIQIYSCYLTNQIFNSNSNEQINLVNASSISNNNPKNYGLLLSYLDFISGLFFFLKWAHSNLDILLSVYDTQIIDQTHEIMELIRGCLVLIIRFLMNNCLRIDHWLKNKWIRQNGLRNLDFDKLLNLAERCFILLADILTTHTTEQDLNAMIIELNHLNNEKSFLYTTVFENNQWPIHLQCLALHLLFTDLYSLNSLITFASIPLRILSKQTQGIENGFPMSMLSINSFQKITSVNTGGPMIKAVWLALSLVHHLLSLEFKLAGESNKSNSNRPVLTSIQSHVDSFTGEHFVTILFTYLQYPYSVGISRLSVAILKWLTQYSALDLMNCLGSHINHVRSSFLYRLISGREDQLTRVGLYDLLAETIMCSDKIGTNLSTLNYHRHNHHQQQRMSMGFLCLLLSNGSVLNKVDEKMKLMHNNLLEVNYSDCLQCTISSLNELHTMFNTKNWNQLSVLLIWSVTKFIASLYLLNLQFCIINLKQNVNFWQYLMDPLLALMNAQENAKEPFSDTENELCGHIISIFAIELFNRMNNSAGSSDSSDAFSECVNRLSKENMYSKWFKFVHNSLNHISTSMDSSNTMSLDLVQSRLVALHNATCRWKCLLLISFSSQKLIVPKQNSSSNVDEKSICLNDLKIMYNSILNQLIECFIPLRSCCIAKAAWDLGNQLATTLTGIIFIFFKLPEESDKIDNVFYDNLVLLITKLTELLINFQISFDTPAQHLHSDLLAAMCILLTKFSQAIRSNEEINSTYSKKLKFILSNLLDCVLEYLIALTRTATSINGNGNPNSPEESAIIHSINMLLVLWDHDCSIKLGERLTDLGIMNNLFIMLAENSQIQRGSKICHSILSLFSKMITSPSSSLFVGRNMYADVNTSQIDLDNQSDGFIDILENEDRSSSSSSSQIIISYHEYISQAFCWPQWEILSQWLQDDQLSVDLQATSAHSNMDSFISSYSSYVTMNHDWINLLTMEIQFLCLLHDQLGGMKHTLINYLITNFYSNNSNQLEQLMNWWCNSLYNVNLYEKSRITSPLPPTITLITDGYLSSNRIRLAKTVSELFWRILVAGQYIGSCPTFPFSGVPIISGKILYSDSNYANSVKLPSYGPPAPLEFCTSVFNLTQRQIHCCAVLLQRPGLKPTKLAGLHTTPIKSGISAQSNMSSCPSPLANVVTKSTNTRAHSVNTTESTLETNGLELICLIRHLVLSLSLLAIQIPMLGTASFLTSEELKQLQISIQLTFNSPSLNDNSTTLTFGVLISLANSLGQLYTKLNAYSKSFHASENKLVQQKRELCSLVHRANEIVLSILFSQSILFLTNPYTKSYEKQLLIREVAAELKSCYSFGRTSRRASSTSHSNLIPTSRSPSSRSSSIHQRLGSASPQTQPYLSGNSVHHPNRYSYNQSICETKIMISDSINFDFDQAAVKFAELLRLTL